MSASRIINTPLLNLYMVADGEGLSLLRPSVSSDKSDGSSEILDYTESWLRLYFSGVKKLPPFPPLSPRGTTFRKRVWKNLLEIPYGKTITYGQLANLVGCSSARAIGGAVGANQIMIVIPCHRVIASDGIGGYAYGIELKQKLISLEL